MHAGNVWGRHSRRGLGVQRAGDGVRWPRVCLPASHSSRPLTRPLLSVAQLKDVVRTLEQLNGNGRWKWLLHYRENKKLRGDVR